MRIKRTATAASAIDLAVRGERDGGCNAAPRGEIIALGGHDIDATSAAVAGRASAHRAEWSGPANGPTRRALLKSSLSKCCS